MIKYYGEDTNEIVWINCSFFKRIVMLETWNLEKLLEVYFLFMNFLIY